MEHVAEVVGPSRAVAGRAPSRLPHAVWQAGRHRWPGKEAIGGSLVALIGLAALAQGLAYGTGTLAMIGAGLFPAAIGIVLVLTGLGIAVSGRQGQRDASPGEGSAESLESLAPAAAEHPHALPSRRGVLCIAAGIVAFVLLGRHGGLLPATFAIVFVSALGDRRNSVLAATVLALGLCAVAFVVFWWALGVQLDLFAWG